MYYDSDTYNAANYYAQRYYKWVTTLTNLIIELNMQDVILEDFLSILNPKELELLEQLYNDVLEARFQLHTVILNS